MIRGALIALALTACGRPAARAPVQQHAFCGSTCWNDTYCRGQGIACERCLGGVCSGSSLLGAAEPADVLRISP